MTQICLWYFTPGKSYLGGPSLQHTQNMVLPSWRIILCQVLLTVGKSYRSARRGHGCESPSGHSKSNQPKAPALVRYVNFQLKFQTVLKKQNTAVSRSVFTNRRSLQLQQTITFKSQEKRFPGCRHWPACKKSSWQNLIKLRNYRFSSRRAFKY